MGVVSYGQGSDVSCNLPWSPCFFSPTCLLLRFLAHFKLFFVLIAPFSPSLAAFSGPGAKLPNFSVPCAKLSCICSKFCVSLDFALSFWLAVVARLNCKLFRSRTTYKFPLWHLPRIELRLKLLKYSNGFVLRRSKCLLIH
jgi:hypothetical protein